MDERGKGTPDLKNWCPDTLIGKLGSGSKGDRDFHYEKSSVLIYLLFEIAPNCSKRDTRAEVQGAVDEESLENL